MTRARTKAELYRLLQYARDRANGAGAFTPAIHSPEHPSFWNRLFWSCIDALESHSQFAEGGDRAEYWRGMNGHN